MRHPRLELLMEPQLSVVCFRYRPAGTALDGDQLNDVTGRILERLRRETGHVPTSAELDGRAAIRPCYINPHTTLEDVKGLVDAVIRLGDEITGA